jgi:hypothetical protein
MTLGSVPMKSIIQIVLLVIVGQIFCPGISSNSNRNIDQETIQVTKDDYMQMIKVILHKEQSANPKNNKVYIVTDGTQQYRLPKLKNFQLFLVTVDEMKGIRQKNKIIEYIDLGKAKIKDDSVILHSVNEFKTETNYFSGGGRIYEFRQKNFSWEVVSISYFSHEHFYSYPEIPVTGIRKK